MKRRSIYSTNSQPESINIFQSFSDLMANAFMILCLFLLVALIYSQYLNKQLIKNNKSLSNLQSVLEQNRQLEKNLNQSLAKNQQLEKLNKRLQSASPIIINEASGNYKFQSGSAELTSDFTAYLKQDIVRQINTILQEKKGQIDFIQVIGHTDGEGINQDSNLDKILETVAIGKQPLKILSAGSNADLGLMRALAVVRELQQTGLQNIEFRAYSAAQLYLPNGELAPPDRQADKTRRRIEIRFIPPGVTNKQ